MKGLPNAGEACYFNAALQCAVYCPNLTNYLLAPGLAEQHVNPKKKLASSLALAYARFTREYWTGEATALPLDTSEVWAAFSKACRQFKPGCQHDAHEALMALLDAVHTGLSKFKGSACIGPAVCAQAWKDGLSGASPLSEVFRGQVEQRVEGPGYTNVTYDHFTSVSMAVADSASLVQCFQKHMAVEEVGDYDPGPARLLKRFTYLPRVLVVHLKRFDGSEKIDKHIEYPVELDLDPFVAPGCEHYYQLFAVCMHRGTPAGGHYVVCCEVKGRWMFMDDDRVTPIHNINDIIQRDAYVLMYKRL